MTRLWTFQNKAVLSLMSANGRHVPSWEFAPENFRPAYHWMTERLAELASAAIDAPPVWCWHSCRSMGMAPTVETARLLLSDDDIERGMIVIELEVPPASMLISSYRDWNEFLDQTIEHRSAPTERKWHSMFNVPPMKYRGDDIQAVTPHIDREWVVAWWPLIVTGRDSCEAI
ncbi:MAG TPA: DUF3841 domain-containing protein [Pirellulales bacterium]|nr:DUF3841 domain-containing protein [Pirellulales bacterium]